MQQPEQSQHQHEKHETADVFHPAAGRRQNKRQPREQPQQQIRQRQSEGNAAENDKNVNIVSGQGKTDRGAEIRRRAGGGHQHGKDAGQKMKQTVFAVCRAAEETGNADFDDAPYLGDKKEDGKKDQADKPRVLKLHAPPDVFSQLFQPGQHDGQQSKRQPDAEQGKGKAAADGRNVAGAEFRQRKQLKRQHRKDAGHEIEQQTADYRCGKHCRQEIPAVGFGRIAADGGKRLAQNIFAVGFNGNFKFFSLGVRFVVKRQQADGGPAAVNANPGTLKSKSRIVADEYVKRFYRFRTVNGQCQHLSPGLHFF